MIENEKYEQMSLFDFIQPDIHEKVMTLPCFQEAKKYLESEGYKSEWITNIVAPSGECAIYIPKRKKTPGSECEFYEGQWIDGGFGSVNCKAQEELLPGMMLDLVCSQNYMDCPFRI